MSVETDRHPPRESVSTRRKVGRAAALPAVLFFLAVSVLFAQPAAALSGGSLIGSAIDVGETLAAPESVVEGTGLAAAGGAACVASVVCAGIVGTGLIGVGLYQSRDSWLPLVGKLFGAGGQTTAPGGGTSVQGSVTASVSGGTLNWQVAYVGNCATCAFPIKADVQCLSGSTLGTLANVQLGTLRGANVSGSTQLCAAPSVVGTIANLAVWQSSTTRNYLSNVVGYGSPVPDDQVSQTTKVTCANADGSVAGTVTATSSGNGDKVEIPSCFAQYPNTVPSHIAVTGGFPGHESPAIDTDLTNPATQYPDCFDSSGHYLASCVVRVWVDGQPCHVGTTGCASWPTEQQDNGRTVECRWGSSYVVPMSDCNQLKRAYQPTTGTRTLTTTDPSGKVADPSDPGAEPAPNPAPTAGANPTPDPTDPTVDGNSTDCLGSGWSMNPVSWVFTPVKCALDWAFVPKDSFQGRIDEIKGRFSGKFPFSLLTPLGAFAASIPDNACPDWTVKVQYPGSGDTTGGTDHTLDKNVVCDSTYTSSIRDARPVFAAMMMVTALWPMIRGIAYGSFPIIKPVPTR